MSTPTGQIETDMLHRRAIEAAIWGMPAVNYDAMLQALLHAAKGSVNQIVYWSRLLDWKNQTLTPNPDTIYVFPFMDTTDGPMVLEIPSAGEGTITGSIDDAWQAAIADVGPAGADAGVGGKYLILPPGYSGEIPDGYLVMASNTYFTFAILRSNLASGSAEDLASALEYGKRVQLYPLSQADSPPRTTFVDASDVVFDSAIPYDSTFFDALNRRVQAEPWLTRDMAMIDTCKTVGIEQGRPFEPTEATRAVLSAAMKDAHSWFDYQYEKIFATTFYDDARWVFPASSELVKATSTGYADPSSYPLDARGVTYTFAYFSPKTLGAGQFYLMTIADSDGQPFDGAATYRLHVPADVPVRLYWSATVYDRVTHTLIRGQPWSSRSSNTPGLHVNADGSVDLEFGPRAVAGPESNWVPTDPDRRFEVMCRFYGPEEPFFAKTWRLPDIYLSASDGTP